MSIASGKRIYFLVDRRLPLLPQQAGFDAQVRVVSQLQQRRKIADESKVSLVQSRRECHGCLKGIYAYARTTASNRRHAFHRKVARRLKTKVNCRGSTRPHEAISLRRVGLFHRLQEARLLAAFGRCTRRAPATGFSNPFKASIAPLVSPAISTI